MDDLAACRFSARSQRPELDGIDTKRQHALTQVEKAETNSKSQEADLAKDQKKLDGLHKDLERAQHEVEQHRVEQKKAAQEKGISLSSEDLAEYNKLYVLFSEGFLAPRARARSALTVLNDAGKPKRRPRPSRTGKRSAAWSTTKRPRATRRLRYKTSSSRRSARSTLSRRRRRR